MPDDKRPRPTIDMTAERMSEPAPPRPALPGGKPAERPSQKRGGGFAGYLLASTIGGIIAGGVISPSATAFPVSR